MSKIILILLFLLVFVTACNTRTDSFELSSVVVDKDYVYLEVTFHDDISPIECNLVYVGKSGKEYFLKSPVNFSFIDCPKNYLAGTKTNFKVQMDSLIKLDFPGNFYLTMDKGDYKEITHYFWAPNRTNTQDRGTGDYESFQEKCSNICKLYRVSKILKKTEYDRVNNHCVCKYNDGSTKYFNMSKFLK